MEKTDLSLPSCPCPICGDTHSRFVSSHLRTLHYTGQIQEPYPHDVYKFDTSPDDVISIIYGPVWKQIYPKLPCRKVSKDEAITYHRDLAGFGDINPKITIIISIILVVIAIKMLFL